MMDKPGRAHLNIRLQFDDLSQPGDVFFCKTQPRLSPIFKTQFFTLFWKIKQKILKRF